jgi:hypothetical protein
MPQHDRTASAFAEEDSSMAMTSDAAIENGCNCERPFGVHARLCASLSERERKRRAQYDLIGARLSAPVGALRGEWIVTATFQDGEPMNYRAEGFKTLVTALQRGEWRLRDRFGVVRPACYSSPLEAAQHAEALG